MTGVAVGGTPTGGGAAIIAARHRVGSLSAVGRRRFTKRQIRCRSWRRRTGRRQRRAARRIGADRRRRWAATVGCGHGKVVKLAQLPAPHLNRRLPGSVGAVCHGGEQRIVVISLNARPLHVQRKVMPTVERERNVARSQRRIGARRNLTQE